MDTSGMRAAIYLRVSRDDQTTENQRLVLTRVVMKRRPSCIERHVLKYKPTADQYQCRRQNWPQYGVRYTGGEITTDDNARHRTGEQRCQQWPFDRTEEPVADAGNQGQRYGVRDVGPNDDCHRQPWVE